MILSEAIDKISYALRGLDDAAPSLGSEEGDYWLSVLNDKIDELYRDTKQNWSGIFSVVSLGTVSAGSSVSFDLDDTFLGLAGDNSDDISGSDAYVIGTDGQKHLLSVVKPQERGSRQELFISGQNPQTITFTQPIVAGDVLIGGTLYLPAYWLPAPVVSESDTLPVPDGNWLVLATAAEIAFNDIIYEDRAEGLNSKANNRYRMMVQNNRRRSEGSVKRVRYVVPKIRGVR